MKILLVWAMFQVLKNSPWLYSPNLRRFGCLWVGNSWQTLSECVLVLRRSDGAAEANSSCGGLGMLPGSLAAGMGSHSCWLHVQAVCYSCPQDSTFTDIWHRLREASGGKGYQGGRVSLGYQSVWHPHPCCEMSALQVLGKGHKPLGRKQRAQVSGWQW